MKWAIVGSNPSGLAGLQAGTSTTAVVLSFHLFHLIAILTFIKGNLTLASAFSKFGKYLQSSASIDTKTTINWSDYGAATIIPATITDSSVATPAIMVPFPLYHFNLHSNKENR